MIDPIEALVRRLPDSADRVRHRFGCDVEFRAICEDYRDIVEILAEHHETMLAAIEIGALEARHVRLFTPDWWRGYDPIEAPQLAAALLAAQRHRLPDDADYRTPWERGDDAALPEFELAQVRRSAQNLRALGLL